MRYFVLLAADPSDWATATEEEREAVFAAHTAFDREVRRRGTMVAGDALADGDTATTLRLVEGKQVVTDGPFAEATEHIGGFYTIDVADLDTAVELCRLLPRGYDIEIRPVVQIEGYDPSDVSAG